MINPILRKDLNACLEIIAEKLDLDETRFKNAEEKYNAVSKWLNDTNSSVSSFRPELYPQGSFALGTVVKPINDDEYDIDLVCKLNDFSKSPQKLKNIVGQRLKENAIYESRLEEKNRCWRLIYANEFHMDILPARPHSISDSSIEVPDKDLHAWSISNPQGYLNWFKSRMMEQYELRVMMAKKSIDPVPEYRIKTTLQQAIQLLKRNRDIVFQEDADDKPISIIITTLAAYSYMNQSDLFETLLSLTQVMPKYIKFIDGEYWVENPVNSEENFAEKWNSHPIRQAKFIEWLTSFTKEINNIHNYSTLSETSHLLELLFGEKLVAGVVEEYTKRRNQATAATIYVAPKVEVRANKPWSNISE